MSPRYALATALTAAILLAAPAFAQTQTRVFHSDGNPAVGGANTFPWSRQELRYQCIFPAAKFQNRPWNIQDILVAPQLSMTPKRRTAIYEDIEIRIGQTPVSTLTSNWNTNNPNPKTIYRGKLRVDFEVGKWRGMGLPQSFLYIPRPTDPNVCVEFIMWKLGPNTTSIRAVTSSNQRAYYYKWTTSQQTQASLGSSAAKMGLVLNSGSFVDVGTGCAGSVNNIPTMTSSGIPTIGKTLDIDLSGGKPASPGIVILGFDRNTFANIPLPFDLMPLGAAGCQVWNDIVVTGGIGINAQGAAKFSLPIPSTLGGTERVYLHWWNLDTQANNFNWTTSNLGVVIVGR